MRLAILIVASCVLGCQGPIPLERAIWPQHVREYAVVSTGSTPGAGWLAYKAERDGHSLAATRAADEALSATRNPFDARSAGDAVSRGAVLFQAHCVRCHGEDASGGGPDLLAAHPTRDFHAFDKRFAVTLHGGAPRAWFRKIYEGYGEEVEYPVGSNRTMPAFGDTFSREQIWMLVTYLQSLDLYAAAPPTDAPPE